MEVERDLQKSVIQISKKSTTIHLVETNERGWKDSKEASMSCWNSGKNVIAQNKTTMRGRNARQLFRNDE